MTAHISHPEVQAVLKRFSATGPIYDTDDFEREVAFLAYQWLRWRTMVEQVSPNVRAMVEDFTDGLIVRDMLRGKRDIGPGDIA